jgi:hypothetical protein
LTIFKEESNYKKLRLSPILSWIIAFILSLPNLIRSLYFYIVWEDNRRGELFGEILNLNNILGNFSLVGWNILRYSSSSLLLLVLCGIGFFYFFTKDRKPAKFFLLFFIAFYIIYCGSWWLKYVGGIQRLFLIFSIPITLCTAYGIIFLHNWIVTKLKKNNRGLLLLLILLIIAAPLPRQKINDFIRKGRSVPISLEMVVLDDMKKICRPDCTVIAVFPVILKSITDCSVVDIDHFLGDKTFQDYLLAKNGQVFLLEDFTVLSDYNNSKSKFKRIKEDFSLSPYRRYSRLCVNYTLYLLDKK